MPDSFLTQIINVDSMLETAHLSYDAVVECPVCHRVLDPRVLCGYYVENRGIQDTVSEYSHTIYLLDFCPKCRHAFLAEYKANFSGLGLSRMGFNDSKFVTTHPKEPSKQIFSEHISTISPSFVETFHQSEAAETAGLGEVAGCGYRKSLEFLVKDYLCRKEPSHTDEIKNEFLGQSIKRVGDMRIQILAERATWIGNDATHYIKLHNNLDIEDMKRFIKAAVHFIDAELTSEDALAISKK